MLLARPEQKIRNAARRDVPDGNTVIPSRGGNVANQMVPTGPAPTSIRTSSCRARWEVGGQYI
jgi:hypothetical protein